MNSLCAGVLGTNDGIVSVAVPLIGVIATGAGDKAILMAGAGLHHRVSGLHGAG